MVFGRDSSVAEPLFFLWSKQLIQRCVRFVTSGLCVCVVQEITSMWSKLSADKKNHAVTRHENENDVQSNHVNVQRWNQGAGIRALLTQMM